MDDLPDDRWSTPLIAAARTAARRLAGRLGLRGADYRDAEAAGVLGLWIAARTYNAARRASYRTWVYTCIRREMYQAARDCEFGKHARRLTTSGPVVVRMPDDADELYAARDGDPTAVVDRDHEARVLAQAPDVLRERARGDSLQEIAARRGVSVGRASQMACAALDATRARVGLGPRQRKRYRRRIAL